MDVNRRVRVQHGFSQLHFVLTIFLFFLSFANLGFFDYNLCIIPSKRAALGLDSPWTYYLEEHLRFGVWKAGRTSLGYDLWIWIWMRMLGKEALITELSTHVSMLTTGK